MRSFFKKIITGIPSSVFTDKEVAALIDVTPDARRALVKRSLASGEIVRLRRGLYLLAREYRKVDIDPLSLAQHLYGPSYVSLETALEFHGWIPEAVYGVRSVSLGISRRFTTPVGDFDFFRVPQRVLYCDVDRVIRGGQVFFMASPLKALADYVYVHKKEWRGLDPVRDSLRVDDDILKGITAAQCRELIANYRSVRVGHFLRGVRKEVLSWQ